MTVGMAVMEKAEAAALLVKSAENITGRVADLKLECVGMPVRMKKETSSFLIHTAGDYAATLIMHAEDCLLWEITRRMKRSAAAAEGDIAVYITEYFNILCGYFISRLNSYLHAKARFGIPEYVKGCYGQGMTGDADTRMEQFFRCPFGNMRLEGINLPINRWKSENGGNLQKENKEV